MAKDQADSKPKKSRAEEQRKRRAENDVAQFSVSVAREKLEKLTARLNSRNKTKTAWLNEKIDEEIGEK